MPDSSEVVARESLWQRRAGAAALLGALLALLGFVLLQAAVGGGANFEGLTEAHDSSAQIWLSGTVTALGYLLFAAPLLFLFRAAAARSPRVRNQMMGVTVIGPVLLAVSAIALSAGTQQAAKSYLDGTAKPTLSPKAAKEECVSERKDKGAKSFVESSDAGKGESAVAACQGKKIKEDEASNAIKEASMVKIGQFTGLVGGLALVVGLFYTCLWAMRTGLLSRLWGSLGMAVGVAALIGLTPLALLWFLYLGLLLCGWVPKGRPPAWAAGEAVPWPTPGESAAKQLEGSEASQAEGIPEPDIPQLPEEGADGPPPSPEAPGERPRKRKRRDSGGEDA